MKLVFNDRFGDVLYQMFMDYLRGIETLARADIYVVFPQVYGLPKRNWNSVWPHIPSVGGLGLWIT